MFDTIVKDAAIWRRHLHAHPELSFEEVETARFIAERLTEMGVPYETGIGGHGIVATLRRGESNRSVALRADTDALPITETNQFGHVSTRPGVMHACGHDGHTAALLGAVRALSQDPDWSGTVQFIFQPAEERGGGAKAMIADGILERFPFERIFAFHNHPGIPVGTISVPVGPLAAVGGRTVIVVEGTSGHAAQPHTARDALVAAAYLVVALQTAVSRDRDPTKPAVLTIGTISGGEAGNQIAERVEMVGTIRTYDLKVRERLVATMNQIAGGVAAAYGVKISIDVAVPGRPCINPEHEAAMAVAAAEAAGLEIVEPVPASMGGDDFGFFQEQVPGAYIRIGNGDDHGKVHTPDYDFNDALLPSAVRWLAGIAKHSLKSE